VAGPANVVVVGGGLAGLRTIEELRVRGYAGRIALVGAEARPPYDRPPLSKKLMTGELDDTSLRADLASLDIDVRLGQAATELRPGTLGTDGGELAFEALVLATGAAPIRLPGPGRQHVLRTVDDALALRELLRPGTRLCVVGAGWIGAELATAARTRGCLVTVLEAAEAPLAAAVGPEIGAITAGWYAEAGADLRLGQQVGSIEAGGVALADGSWVAADVVVTAIGVRPAVAWLAGSGVGLDNGVAADAQLRTTMPGVFAAGDCASFWSARYGRRLRFEHWDMALHQPEVVASGLLGGSEAYDPVPYFWSEQFGRMVQYVGWHGDAERAVWRGDPAGQKWAVCWLNRGRLAAALTVSTPRDMLQSRRLIEAGVQVDPDRLADPAIPIRDCTA
jgi:3-phenylpropionate/trans-cinnamate dioxygenase ferredoxin reductase component